jgi:hypothetical protein
MFYRESCSAGSKESSGNGDGSRPSNLQGQSLQDRGFLAVGALQIHSGLVGQGRAVIDALNEIITKRASRAFGSAITGFAVTAMYGTTNECIGCIAK